VALIEAVNQSPVIVLLAMLIVLIFILMMCCKCYSWSNTIYETYFCIAENRRGKVMLNRHHIFSDVQKYCGLVKDASTAVDGEADDEIFIAPTGSVFHNSRQCRHFLSHGAMQVCGRCKRCPREG
jgi:hypothetical protein